MMEESTGRRWWLGGRPASARVMRAMLEAGASPVVCPGGVRECLFLRHDAEVVFLRQRLGFVRIALQYGGRCSGAQAGVPQGACRPVACGMGRGGASC